MTIRLIGLLGSKSATNIARHCDIVKCRWYKTKRSALKFVTPYQADVLINYGVQGTKLTQFYDRWPRAIRIPTLNGNVRRIANKKRTLDIVSEAGVPVPASWSNAVGAMFSERRDWIVKPYYSGQGKGIYVWDGNPIPGTHYIQKRIRNRRYEVRVSPMTWLPEEEWAVWKKVKEEGERDENVTWNHDTGGRFITVKTPSAYRIFRECRTYARTVLSALGLHFGGVDFIVGNDGSIHFIEINTRPGFTDLAETYYVDAFKKFVSLSHAQQLEVINGQ